MYRLGFLFLLFNFVCHFGFSQSRQPDSLKLKQQQYWAKQKADALKAKEQAAIEANRRKANVVTYDSKGNKVEIKKGNSGETITTTTIIKPSVLNRKFELDTIDKDSIFIRVYKSKNRMQVYHKGKVLTAYKCVFGPGKNNQKQQEGDRTTPLGSFKILHTKHHDKWDVFMLLDYPNEESVRIYEENKAKGIIDKNAKIGGLIGIHGIWPNGDNVIDLKHNWTDGCISMKNKDVEELNKIVKPGYTYITIVP